MNDEAANDVDPKYYLNPRSIATLQVCVEDACVGVVYALCGCEVKICVGE